MKLVRAELKTETKPDSPQQIMHVAFIDHYDSFSYNLIDWLGQGSPSLEIEYIAKDDVKAMELLRLRPRPLVLSPGPGHPLEQTATSQLARDLLGTVPILGICLGHQILGLIAGGTVVRSRFPLHGSCRVVDLEGECRLFAAAPSPLCVASYNSLTVQGVSSGDWKISARSRDGDVQAIEQHKAPWLTAGVQFHPESHLSENCAGIAQVWMAEARRWFDNH